MEPKYLLDQMFNGLAEDLQKDGIDCETATQRIHGDDDSRVSISDDAIVEFLKRETGFVLITADKRLAKRCDASGIRCVAIDQRSLVLDHIRRAKR
ncbi:MAG: hypothetical protein ABSF83_01850 [Nitrososphaerales archaeon]